MRLRNLTKVIEAEIWTQAKDCLVLKDCLLTMDYNPSLLQAVNEFTCVKNH